MSQKSMKFSEIGAVVSIPLCFVQKKKKETETCSSSPASRLNALIPMEVNIHVNWESGCVCDDKGSVGVFVHFSWTCQKLSSLPMTLIALWTENDLLYIIHFKFMFKNFPSGK